MIALLLGRLPVIPAFVLAGIVVVAVLLGIAAFEQAPYERQQKKAPAPAKV
jgi:uncharacterized membrane protein YphA (DoxX/SURF4 family)